MESEKTGKADYSYWLKVRVWDSEEAAALILGYEPEYTHYLFINRLRHKDEPEDIGRTAISVEADNLEKILQSAQLAGELGKVQLNQVGEPWGKTVTWQKWVSWAKRNKIGCANELLTAIAELEDQKELGPEEIHPRREANLLRVIGALLYILKEKSRKSEAQIIQRVEDLFRGRPGLAKSTLQNVFKLAKDKLIDY